MRNTSTSFENTFYRSSVFLSSFFAVFFSLPVNAATVFDHSISNYNVAFVLGMIIPVILMLVLLKPVAEVRLRYPIVLSAALLIQLFGFNQIEDNQFNLVLIGASAFVSAILQISIAEKLTGKKKIIFTLTVFFFLSLFIAGVLILPSENIDELWLAFSSLNFLLIVTGGLLLHKTNNFYLGREFVIWFLVSVYCIAVSLRSTTTMADYGVIISAIVIYLMFITNYCRSVVKNNILQLTTVSDKSSPSQGYGNNQNFDPITNLPNYHQSLHCLRHFNNHDPSALAIIVFKPINFAQVNKVLGHQNSDILLLQLAYNLQKSIVDNELLVNFNQPKSPIRLARLQGLDFVVAIDANASHHPIKILVEELCKELTEAVPHALSFKSFSLNFDLKFGVAFVNEHHNDLEQTIACAGDALLESEQNHQLVWYFNQETAIYTEQKLLIMERLKQDIIDNKLTWLLQPQISLSESQLIGFELLTDWHSTNGNTLDMKEFIEIAEYSGEMYHLTRQIIEKACLLIASLHRENFYVHVSVNLSSQDVLEHDLIEFIEEISDKHYTSLRYLVIELDETLLFKAADKTKLVIDQLKSIGVKVSINNFSGSYEALRYLRRLAIDQVKVDCSLLKGGINEGKSEKTIISALINLIRKMKIPLIATGINNSEIKNTYVDIGGDIGQGNLLTNGINLEDAKAWTAQWLKEHVGNYEESD